MEALKIIEYKDHTISIYADKFPESPREWSTIGTVCAFHRNYTLSDSPHKKDHTMESALATIVGLLTEEEIRQVLLNYINRDKPSLYELKTILAPYNDRYYSEILKDELASRLTLADFKDCLFYLPVYIYEHGSIALSTGSFSCPWDSGQVGFIYCLNSKMLKESIDLDSIGKILESEIDLYSDYANGNVYGYNIEGPNCEDNCAGYYGSDHADLLAAAKQAIDWSISEAKEVFRSDFLQITE